MRKSRPVKVVMFLCLFMIGLAGAWGLAMPLPTETPREEVHPGKVIYQLHCARCHGPTGLGDGPQAQGLKVPPPNFHDPAFQAKSDEGMRRSIEYGEGPMHAWRGRVTEQELRDVASYVRHLGTRGH